MNEASAQGVEDRAGSDHLAVYHIDRTQRAVERHNRGMARPEGEADICRDTLVGEEIYPYRQQEVEGVPDESHRIHGGEHQGEAHIHGSHAARAAGACPSLGEEAGGNHTGHREVAFEVGNHHEAHLSVGNLFGCGQSEVARSSNVWAW